MLSNHEFGLGENVTHEDHLFVTKINLICARDLYAQYFIHVVLPSMKSLHMRNVVRSTPNEFHVARCSGI